MSWATSQTDALAFSALAETGVAVIVVVVVLVVVIEIEVGVLE